MKGTANALHIEVDNSTRYCVNEDAVAELTRTVLTAEGVTAGELGVNFVGERRMRALNRAYRRADYVTDVLAFPLEEARELAAPLAEPQALATPLEEAQELAAPLVPRLLGDVVVCLKRAEGGGAFDGLALSLEVAVLLVHGILHILGYDHEVDAGEMARREEGLRQQVAWQGLVSAAGG